MGRDVGHRPSNHLSVVTGWLRQCHENHPNCPGSTDVAMPSRVLDIGGDLVRLIEVASGQRGRYTALSHCWGGGIDIRTTKENYSAQKKGLRYCDLPLSFQDAITVTRGLGLRYLWIDALCIIQDCQNDWEIESANMAAIYRNAHLVIGADMSSNSLGGFLDVQSSGYNGDGWPIATVNNNIIYARSERNSNNNSHEVHPLHSEPLSARAWTLQEQILSSRMVHFASKEMVWEYEVTGRSLTKPQDLLPCLSGIAQHFQDSGAGAYLAGLWRDDLPMGLLWSSGRLDQSSRAIPYRGPSWSWTSIDQIKYPYTASPVFLIFENTFKKIYVTVIEATCIPAGKDPLGAVSGGYLRMAGPLLKLERDMGIVPHYDSHELQRENLFCLFIGEFTSGQSLGAVHGLILWQQYSGKEVGLIQGVEDSIVTIV
ncbi:heterokaryon incompatibility protein-domain-containing protein [Fusarium flagelliforme]|uniref:heterokaryon incompatibility protein-domain-containing protein n=1 Tax=Fusarium flagelliforme TaxID=2675880 RepID=UPI001E8CF51C|nr:heterokaryon incompatibility protein-domain-containing protein [Fusarium flagelliforme]KAH7183593.1 heterokaryon incompatibility protein-domain-containing protein [Fusarium flagelliforme]